MEDALYAFNYTQNRDKLFANLISIIDGIIADGVVREEEVLYLDTWLLEAKGNDSNLLIVFYVQIMPDDFVMQLHRF